MPMDHTAYVRVLLSVWVGLGLGQLVQALHRLARFKGTVRWDWLALTWAGLAFLMFVQTWWAYFTLLEPPIWSNLFAFLLPLGVFVVLYLICATALPDVSKTAEGAVVDLGAHYLAQHRYFFGLWGVLLVLASIISALVRGGFHPLGGDGLRLAGIAGAILLIRSGNRTVHVIVTLFSLVALIAYIVLFTLKLG
jgi:hypothetical protein